MLAWQREISADPLISENLTFAVEALDCIVDGEKCIFINLRSPHQITELQKGADSTDHLRRYMACDSWEVDLFIVSKARDTKNVLSLPS